MAVKNVTVKISAEVDKSLKEAPNQFNKTNKEVKKLDASVDDLNKDFKKLEQAIKKASSPKEALRLARAYEKQQKAVRNTTKEVDKLAARGTKGFNALNSTLGKIGIAVGAAFVVKKIIDFGKEAVLLAAKAEGIKRAFDELNQPNLLDDLREATRGTVSDLNLMRNAVLAKNFKVPLEDLAKFFEFATIRAAATGESVDRLVSSIVLGIGRKSIRVIDNLGISAAELQQEVKKTGDFAKGVGVIIDKELGMAGDTTLTAAQQFSQFNATIENLKLEIGEAILFGLKPFLNILQSLISGNIIKDLGKQIDGLTGSVGDLNEEFAKLTAEQIDKIEVSTEFLRLQNEQLSRGIILTAEQTEALKEQAEAIVRQRKAQQEADDNAEAARAKSIKEIKQLIAFQKGQLELETERANIIPIQKEILRLEAQIAALLGKETEAQKKARLEEEKRLEDLRKAEEARKKQIQEGIEDTLKRNVKANDDLALLEAQRAVDAATTIEERVEKEIELEKLRAEQLVEQKNVTADELTLIEQEFQDKKTKIEKKGGEDRLANEQELTAARLELQEAQFEAISIGVTALQNIFAGNAQAQAQLLVFEKLLAMAKIIVNTQAEISAISLAHAAIPGGIAIAAPLIAAAKIRAGISIATIGATAIPQFKVVSQEGFAEGGYTGEGGKHQVAGIVHKKEFVMDSEPTSKYRDELEAMHEGKFEDFVLREYLSKQAMGGVSFDYDDKRLRGSVDTGNDILVAVNNNIVNLRQEYRLSKYRQSRGI